MGRAFGICCVWVLTGTATGWSADWPRWRGPRADGVCTQEASSWDWSAGKPKELWRTRIGNGYSAVSVVNGRLYTMGCPDRRTQSETVYCLDAATGKELWTHTYKLSLQRGRSPVAGTPTVVDGRVYTYGAGADLHCLDAATGKVIWGKALAKEHGASAVSYGYCASPLVTAGCVVAPVFRHGRSESAPGPSESEPRGGPYPSAGGVLVALDARTGEPRWTCTAGASAWSSPIACTIRGKDTIVHATGAVLLGVDPATGKILWRYGRPAGRRSARGFEVAATPAVSGNRIVFPINVRRSAVCVEVGEGKARCAWIGPRQSWTHSAVVWDGHVYVPTTWGATCVEMATGERKWRLNVRDEAAENGRATSGRENDGGSFLIANGTMLLIDGRGHLVAARVSGAGFEVLADVALFHTRRGAFKYETVPVLANGRLYCRSTAGELVCMGLSGR